MIVFNTPKTGVFTIWNDAEERYEVNSQEIDRPGLPELVALDGRFMAKHYRRCAAGVDSNFWNSFRYGVTDYILSTTGVPFPAGRLQDQMIGKALRQIEADLLDQPQVQGVRLHHTIFVWEER